MASDLSNIFKNELTNTLEQLLGKKVKIAGTNKYEDIKDTSFIECNAKFDLKGISTGIIFYIPNSSSLKFEHLILGGMGDLEKENIDDETIDAVNEIVSNICGSFCTVSNAQSLPDVVGMKSEIKSSKKVDNSAINKQNSFIFKVLLDEEETPLIIYFDQLFLPFFSEITGIEEVTKVQTVTSAPSPTQTINSHSNTTIANPSKNLELLYNVRLKLSVRLGTKIVLLKDILRWDVGEIIELEQMVNEPLELLINGVKIGEGEAVIVEGKFGLKIKRIINEDLKIDKIGL
ncbi:FliM/FliN family flagellar motor switch protein [Aliarcobacter lanthieri]|uniref:FliM/FliN family flagellar motor switch protein n=1 Tax=Aliarcobacter lanthieri TaxID=1355374 RepID=UPI003AAF1766